MLKQTYLGQIFTNFRSWTVDSQRWGLHSKSQPHKPHRSLALKETDNSATLMKGMGNELSSGEGGIDSGSDSYDKVETLIFDSGEVAYW